MKKDIHPTYHPDGKITCACGASYDVGSTVKETHVDICSNCHPFYTGKQKLIDTARRVEKFEEKIAKKQPMVHRSKSQKKAALKAKRDTKVAVRKEVTKLGGTRKKARADNSNKKTEPATKEQAKEQSAD